jgi:hypothetical protein
MVSVDLHAATGEQRRCFDTAMRAREWTKLHEVTTTWKASFDESVSRVDAETLAKRQVKEAARLAGIADFDAALLSSGYDVSVFTGS